MKRKLAGAVITMLAGALAAGCGDGSGDGDASATTAPAPALTKAQFVAAADKVCAETNARIALGATKLKAAGGKTGTIPVPDVARFLTQTSLPAYDAQLDRLRELTPPAGDEQAIDAYVAALAGAIDTARKDTLRYARDPTPDPFDDANAQAQRYGMKVCGS